VKRAFSRMSSRLSWNPLSVSWDDSNYTPISKAHLRIGLIGNMSCGKTSIVTRILDPKFEDWENVRVRDGWLCLSS
jgi:GTPase SAR1 family protein